MPFVDFFRLQIAKEWCIISQCVNLCVNLYVFFVIVMHGHGY